MRDIARRDEVAEILLRRNGSPVIEFPIARTRPPESGPNLVARSSMPRGWQMPAMAEYGLLLGLIAAIVAGGASIIGKDVSTFFNSVNGSLTNITVP